MISDSIMKEIIKLCLASAIHMSANTAHFERHLPHQALRKRGPFLKKEVPLLYHSMICFNLPSLYTSQSGMGTVGTRRMSMILSTPHDGAKRIPTNLRGLKRQHPIREAYVLDFYFMKSVSIHDF